jgi:hypothetical protein
VKTETLPAAGLTIQALRAEKFNVKEGIAKV